MLVAAFATCIATIVHGFLLSFMGGTFGGSMALVFCFGLAGTGVGVGVLGWDGGDFVLVCSGFLWSGLQWSGRETENGMR